MSTTKNAAKKETKAEKAKREAHPQTLPREKNILECAKVSEVLLYPDEITIPGPEYDSMGLFQEERNEMMPDPGEVERAMASGIHTPIIAFRDGATKVVVIDGRQRVKICGAANERLAALGGNRKWRVPVKIVRGSEVEFVRMSMTTNLDRHDQGPITLSRQMNFLHSQGEPIEKIAALAKVKVTQARKIMKLMELCEEGRRLCEARKITIEVAHKLTSKPRAEQQKVLKSWEADKEKRQREAKQHRSYDRKVIHALAQELDSDDKEEKFAKVAFLLAINEITPEQAFEVAPWLQPIWEQTMDVDGVGQRRDEIRSARDRAKHGDRLDIEHGGEASRAVG